MTRSASPFVTAARRRAGLAALVLLVPVAGGVLTAPARADVEVVNASDGPMYVSVVYRTQGGALVRSGFFPIPSNGVPQKVAVNNRGPVYLLCRDASGNVHDVHGRSPSLAKTPLRWAVPISPNSSFSVAAVGGDSGVRTFAEAGLPVVFEFAGHVPGGWQVMPHYQALADRIVVEPTRREPVSVVVRR
jgi:hypothetical protein